MAILAGVCSLGICDENSYFPEGEKASEEVIFPVLNGLAVVELESERSLESVPDQPGFSSVPDLSEPARKKLEAYLGGPVSFATLAEMRGIIVDDLDENFSYLHRAIIPEQEVTDGMLSIGVIRAEISGIEIDSNSVSPDDLLSAVGKVLNRDDLVADLDWLNRSQFHDFSLIYRPGERIGETEVVFSGEEKKLWQLIQSYDNYGVDSLGEHRVGLGASHGNLLGRNLRASYQFISDIDFENLDVHFGSLVIPMHRMRHEIRWSGYYADSDASYDLGAGLGSLNLGGQSWQSSLEYRVPLSRAWQRKVRHEIVLGFESKGSNSNLIFGQFDPIRSNTEIYQFKAGYEMDWRDLLGKTAVNLSLLGSPGNWNDQNGDAAFEASRAGADSTYTYFNAGLDRTLSIPVINIEITAEIDAQLASDNLLPSEQLALSGPYAVRGFTPSEIRGDRGVVSRFELRLPGFSSASWIKRREIYQDGWQPYAFSDWAWGESVYPLPGEGDVSLGSAGLGIRTVLNECLFADLNYGWQVAESGFEDENRGRFQAQVTLLW